MAIFFKKKEEVSEEVVQPDIPTKKFKDLNYQNKKKREEPPKPWGIKERLLVLSVLLFTVLTSGVLALSARNFKLPNLPPLNINLTELNPFREHTFVIGSKGSKISEDKIENVKKLFKEATNSYSGMYAFYIYDLNGDYYYGYNHQKTMQAASLIKLPVMYMAMDKDKDLSLVEAMGKRSDNNAFRKTIEILGKENVNKEIYDLGMVKTSLDKNLTSPEEIGIFFKKLYNNELLDEDKSNLLMGHMTDTIFENYLRLGIPENITLVHKYGREQRVINDAGIILTNKPFVMVIMTDGIIESEAEALFPKLTKLLYDNHINQ